MAGKKTPDSWFSEDRAFSAGLLQLRELAKGAGLTETLKWGQPCYTHESRNIVGIGAFKTHFALWFFDGARLEDKEGVLTNAQPGKTQMMRQWRFSSADDIQPAIIKRYLKAARLLPPPAPKKAVPTKTSQALPAELTKRLEADPKLSAAFRSLTLGRQREYAAYIDEAKQAQTRARRLAKITPLITSGLGLNDKYR